MRTHTDNTRSSCDAPIFVRGRWSLIALAAVTFGVVGVGSLAQVNAHEEPRGNRTDRLPATAELVLPQLEPGTYRLVVRKSEADGFVGSFKRHSHSEDAWRKRAPEFSLRVPNEPAPRRVAKPAFKVRAGDFGTLAVPKNFAMIDAPRRVFAQKRFAAGWSGPNVSGDRLELLARGQRPCADSVIGISVHEYDANRDGEFTLLAPMRPGSYELVYCSVNQGRVLARHPIQVLARTVASVRTDRVSRLRAPARSADAGGTTTTRPSFELNSSVDDRTALPRVRMIAPLASARTTDLEDARPRGPVFTVRPKRFVENDVVTPVGRFRFNDQRLAQATTVEPAFSVRPKFAPEDDAADRFEAETPRRARINPEEDDVIDIAPRRRATFDDEPTLERLPRVRVFVDDDTADVERPSKRSRKSDTPLFDDEDAFDAPREDVFEKQEARKPSFEGEEQPERVAKAPNREEEPVRRKDVPVFDDEDAFSPATPKVTQNVKAPSFDDEQDTTFSNPTFAERPKLEDEGPVDRADDFKDGDVDVASAIARNRARYGDGRDGGDDFFSIKGRYDWYKPVEPKKNDRTANLPVQTTDRDDAFQDTRRNRDDERRRTTNRGDREDTVDDNEGRVIELKGRDAFEPEADRRGPIVAALPKPKALPREQDFDQFTDGGNDDGDAVFGPPVREDDRRFASRNADDLDLSDDSTDFDGSSRSGPATGPIAMVRKSDNSQIAPQFDRIQPVKAGYRFAAGWTGDIRRKGWIAVARSEARIDDYLSLRAADAKGERKFRAPSKPGRYELRFLSQDRRVVLARQSFEVEAAPVRLVALEFVDPADELNVWWAGPGDGTDSLTLARVGTQDSRYLSKQSVGKGNPLTLKAPTQPGTYEMRYVNGTDNRVLFRRKLVVAESQPKLLGP